MRQPLSSAARCAAQEITPGKVARAQLAKTSYNPEEAFKLMAGKEFIVEAKYDGAWLASWLHSCCWGWVG